MISSVTIYSFGATVAIVAAIGQSAFAPSVAEKCQKQSGTCMPSFSLPPHLIPHFLPLPGHSLLKCSPAEPMTESQLLHLPESARDNQEQAKALRKGQVVRTNYRPDKYIKTNWDALEILSLSPGVVVLYQGHADETDNQYVIVLHGQIQAILS